jgi:hypothetical protein
MHNDVHKATARNKWRRARKETVVTRGTVGRQVLYIYMAESISQIPVLETL